jgi:P-type E1-E2 ATPase
MVGIKDPIREQVPLAVQQCYTAGVKVRMITGDNP